MTRRDLRQAWAAALIRRGRAAGAVPRYGDPVWLALPEGDPRKVAAVVVAAEAWATEGDELPRTLADEVAIPRWLDEQRCDEQWPLVAATVRRRAALPTHAELQRRRAS